ncbi:MAG: DUF4926 domain-containing protein [Planctomycetes bacterium]|nr:DUF4926 domain-containing protein [Planctomycetota bacterium]
MTSDVAAIGLEAGDVSTGVHVRAGGANFEVEFVTMTCATVAVTTVPATQSCPVGRQDISHVREPRSRRSTSARSAAPVDQVEPCWTSAEALGARASAHTHAAMWRTASRNSSSRRAAKLSRRLASGRRSFM